ncbi:MAG TPA: ankyrin repeat domain-containing protein [Acidobacteriota bacterium]
MRTIIALAVFLLVSCCAIAEAPKADLMKAASTGDTARIRELLEGGEDVNAKHAVVGWTALTAAAYYGHPEAVKLLLEAGAEPNMKDASADTPLMKAVTLGPYEDRQEMLKRKAEVARLLLKAGADPTTRDRFGVAVWQMPMNDQLSEIVDVFEQAGVKGIKEEKLIQAVDRGDLESARKLIEQGADPNAKADDGASAWSQANLWGNLKIINLFLQSGADVNAKWDRGITALMVAVDRSNVQCAEKLIAAGADVNAADDDGISIWKRADQKGNNDVILLLERSGARPQ